MKGIFFITALLIILTSGTLLLSKEWISEDESEEQILADVKEIKKYRRAVIEWSIFSPLEIFPYENKSVDGLQITLPYGRTARLRGVCIGLFHYVRDDMNGVEADLFNYVGGDARGVQASLVNINRGDVSGLQVSLANYVSGNARGVQAALMNITNTSTKGVQTGLVNYTKEIQGPQIGLINYCEKMNGSQIGIINICHEMDGMPIGLINIILNGQLDVSIWGSLGTLGNISLIMRANKYAYGITMFGYDWRGSGSEKIDNASIGFGLGMRLPFKSFFLDYDFSFHFVLEEYNKNSFEGDGYYISKHRLMAGWQIIKFIGIFVGFVNNTYIGTETNGRIVDFTFGINLNVL